MTDALKLALFCKRNKVYSVVINSERWRGIRYGFPDRDVGIAWQPWDSAAFDLLYEGITVRVKSAAIPYNAIYQPIF